GRFLWSGGSRRSLRNDRRRQQKGPRRKSIVRTDADDLAARIYRPRRLQVPPRIWRNQIVEILHHAVFEDERRVGSAAAGRAVGMADNDARRVDRVRDAVGITRQ